MLVAWAELPLGFIAFLLTAKITSQFISSGVPVLLGLMSAALVWLYFKSCDDRRFEDLLNPEPELWPVPLPIAWGLLLSIFDGPIIMRNNENGLLPWRLLKHDQMTGSLSAYLDSNSFPQGPILATVSVQLMQKPTGTIVRLSYKTDKYDRNIEKLISLTNRWLIEDLEHLVSPELDASME